MDRIRAFTQEDIPGVAALFQKVFRGNAEVPESLKSYFAHLYFENPWFDQTIPSLICEEHDTIRGFVGALPFPFLIRGKRIMSVLAGNLMVDPGLRNPLTAVRLLKQLFAGPQDATLTDTSSDVARKIWEGLGSATVHTYSLQWLRILRPSRFVTSTWIGSNAALRPLGYLARPVTTGLDWFFGQFPRSPLRPDKSELEARELSVEMLLDGIQAFSRKQILVPDYNAQTLEWLVTEASNKQEYGPLRKVALYDKEGSLAGWYMYYPNHGKAGQVLQCIGKQAIMRNVLSHLFDDALRHGSVALIGRFDPAIARELSEMLCMIVQRGSYVQAISRNPDVLQALYSGNAFFTRLEGEWWTRFQGDKF